MTENESTVAKVRAAIKDRALYLAFLYRSFARALPPEQAEKLAREAIFEYGQHKGWQDGGPVTAEQWVDRHMAKGSGQVFQSRIVKEADRCEQQMTHCPLLEAWRELGCTPEEIDLFCDIAMEVDRGRAAYHGLPLELAERMGRGDASCRLVFPRR